MESKPFLYLSGEPILQQWVWGEGRADTLRTPPDIIRPREESQQMAGLGLSGNTP